MQSILTLHVLVDYLWPLSIPHNLSFALQIAILKVLETTKGIFSWSIYKSELPIDKSVNQNNASKY